MGKSLISVHNIVQILKASHIYGSKAYESSTVRTLKIPVQGCNFFCTRFYFELSMAKPDNQTKAKKMFGNGYSGVVHVGL